MTEQKRKDTAGMQAPWKNKGEKREGEKIEETRRPEQNFAQTPRVSLHVHDSLIKFSAALSGRLCLYRFRKALDFVKQSLKVLERGSPLGVVPESA